MVQELGETRDAMAAGCIKYVEDFVSKMKHEYEPFYVVYCARQDYLTPNRIIQTIKAYRDRPPSVLGILVWYVDNPKGIMQFRPDLSAPWDVPLDESNLSDKSYDQFARVMQRGEDMKVIVS